MALERIDALSREDIPFTVRAFKDGEPYDFVAAGATVDAAFLPSSRAKPSSGDWKACTWDTNLIGTFVALCNVGPGGVFVPTAGKTYFTWLRVTVTGEVVIRPTGRLIVE